MIRRLLAIGFIVQLLFIGITYFMIVSVNPKMFLVLKDQDSTNLNFNFFSRRIASSTMVTNPVTNNSQESLVREQATSDHNQTSSIISSVTPSALHSTVREQGDMKLNTFLLIMVSTTPESFIARETIRDTWLHGLNDSEDAIVRFAVGTKDLNGDEATRLQKENDLHKDMVIMEDVKDYYITPTSKTLSMIVWAHNNVDFKYFMKSDPITFVHVANMVSVLQQRPTTKSLYYGRMQYKRKPNRKSSEYKDTAWDLTETYLPFALGGCYIVSSDLTAHIAHRRNYLKLYPNEDTAVASWIVKYHFERRDDNLLCVTKLGKTNQLEGKCEDYVIAQMCYGVSEVNLRGWFTKIGKSKS